MTAFALAGAAVTIVALLVNVGLRVVARNCDDFQQRFGEIVESWQRGDLIILVRHTEKCSESEPGCSPDDPGLTTAGFNQARQIGTGIKALGPAESDIYYSPTTRTELTARTAFTGDMQPLGFLLDDCAVDLMAKASRLKKQAVNLVLVTHSHCLNELRGAHRQPLLEFNASYDAYYGVALFFNHTGNGDAEMVSCAAPEHWEEIRLHHGN